jgi:hypothetical protein
VRFLAGGADPCAGCAGPCASGDVVVRGQGDGPRKSLAYAGAPWKLRNTKHVTTIDLSGVSVLGLRCSLLGCHLLEMLILPKLVVRLPEQFCAYCLRLKYVNLHECSQLRVIEECCFEDCVSLCHVPLPDDIEDVHPDAFWRSGVESFNLRRAFRLRGLVSRTVAGCRAWSCR